MSFQKNGEACRPLSARYAQQAFSLSEWRTGKILSIGSRAFATSFADRIVHLFASGSKHWPLSDLASAIASLA
jgi:hypothetical protein